MRKSLETIRDEVQGIRGDIETERRQKARTHQEIVNNLADTVAGNITLSEDVSTSPDHGKGYTEVVERQEGEVSALKSDIEATGKDISALQQDIAELERQLKLEGKSGKELAGIRDALSVEEKALMESEAKREALEEHAEETKTRYRTFMEEQEKVSWDISKSDKNLDAQIRFTVDNYFGALTDFLKSDIKKFEQELTAEGKTPEELEAIQAKLSQDKSIVRERKRELAMVLGLRSGGGTVTKEQLGKVKQELCDQVKNRLYEKERGEWQEKYKVFERQVNQCVASLKDWTTRLEDIEENLVRQTNTAIQTYREAQRSARAMVNTTIGENDAVNKRKNAFYLADEETIPEYGDRISKVALGGMPWQDLKEKKFVAWLKLEMQRPESPLANAAKAQKEYARMREDRREIDTEIERLVAAYAESESERRALRSHLEGRKIFFEGEYYQAVLDKAEKEIYAVIKEASYQPYLTTDLTIARNDIERAYRNNWDEFKNTSKGKTLEALRSAFLQIANASS